jgi:GNAT superfamily N-acetyltransferase
MNGILGPRAEPVSLAARPDAPALFRVRRAVAGDRAALTRMFDRCTRRTRYDRFHGHVNVLPQRYLTEALSGSPVHYALVALAPLAAGVDGDGAGAGSIQTTDRDDLKWRGSAGTGPAADDADGPGTDIVALASCRAIAEGVAELGLLVEDRWQHCGLGGRLLGELVGHADRLGLRVLTAQILSEQSWIINMLRGYGTCRATRGSYGILDVTLRLRRGSPPPPSTPAQEALRLMLHAQTMTKRSGIGASEALRLFLQTREGVEPLITARSMSPWRRRPARRRLDNRNQCLGRTRPH